MHLIGYQFNSLIILFASLYLDLELDYIECHENELIEKVINYIID